MSKSLTILALIVALVAGCATQGQFLASRQETAIQTALTRGRFDLNCPSATRRGAFARSHPTRHPGTLHGRRTTRPIYYRRCGVQPTASVPGRMPNGWRQMSSRSKVASSERDFARRFRVSVFRCCQRMVCLRWPRKRGVVFVREADAESQISDVLRCASGGRMYDRGPISRQPTTDSDGSGRKPRAIRNELSKRNRRDAFTGVCPGRPDADRTGRIQRAIYGRRYGLRPTARLSGFLRDEGRRLHAARRWDAVSGNS